MEMQKELLAETFVDSLVRQGIVLAKNVDTHYAQAKVDLTAYKNLMKDLNPVVDLGVVSRNVIEEQTEQDTKSRINDMWKEHMTAVEDQIQHSVPFKDVEVPAGAITDVRVFRRETGELFRNAVTVTTEIVAGDLVVPTADYTVGKNPGTASNVIGEYVGDRTRYPGDAQFSGSIALFGNIESVVASVAIAVNDVVYYVQATAVSANGEKAVTNVAPTVHNEPYKMVAISAAAIGATLDVVYQDSYEDVAKLGALPPVNNPKDVFRMSEAGDYPEVPGLKYELAKGKVGDYGFAYPFTRELERHNLTKITLDIHERIKQIASLINDDMNTIATTRATGLSTLTDGDWAEITVPFADSPLTYWAFLKDSMDSENYGFTPDTWILSPKRYRQYQIWLGNSSAGFWAASSFNSYTDLPVILKASNQLTNAQGAAIDSILFDSSKPFADIVTYPDPKYTVEPTEALTINGKMVKPMSYTYTDETPGIRERLQTNVRARTSLKFLEPNEIKMADKITYTRSRLRGSESQLALAKENGVEVTHAQFNCKRKWSKAQTLCKSYGHRVAKSIGTVYIFQVKVSMYQV
ncbi:MAG: hypothetical protein EZS28_037312 [Streblomastix strix]|uniref:Uncharacterized protein n=1 Tax=Streblomastix strix TaxID=222440 RepID=A0A5J4UB73_9EUKA|nr:MAG: hypothetical protein EZS28_037312 [Streblomastix strix]